MYQQVECNVWNCEFKEEYIRVTTKEGLPQSMKYEMEDQDQYCRAFTHEEWFDLLSTLKSNDDINRAADKIKRLYRQRAEP